MIRKIRDYLKSRRTGYKEPRIITISGGSNTKKENLKVDLREGFLKARDQKWTEACTGFASAALFEYLKYKQTGIKEYISPLFIWYNGKLKHSEKDATKNTGVWLQYTLDVTLENGYVPESVMPFRPSYTRKPREGNYLLANIITRFYLPYHKVRRLTPFNVREELKKGNPIVFGIRLNKSFYGNKDGVIKDINHNKYSHAMLLVGFDDEEEVFIVRNSWGIRWGDKGYCYIPYNYFYNNARDCWTIIEKGDEQ